MRRGGDKRTTAIASRARAGAPGHGECRGAASRTLARRVGIERFRLVALSENFPVLHWMESLGASVDCDDGATCEVLVDLREDARGQIPMTPEGDELLEWLDRLEELLDSFSN